MKRSVFPDTVPIDVLKSLVQPTREHAAKLRQHAQELDEFAVKIEREILDRLRSKP